MLSQDWIAPWKCEPTKSVCKSLKSLHEFRPPALGQWRTVCVSGSVCSCHTCQSSDVLPKKVCICEARVRKTETTSYFIRESSLQGTSYIGIGVLEDTKTTLRCHRGSNNSQQRQGYGNREYRLGEVTQIPEEAAVPPGTDVLEGAQRSYLWECPAKSEATINFWKQTISTGGQGVLLLRWHFQERR